MDYRLNSFILFLSILLSGCVQQLEPIAKTVCDDEKKVSALRVESKVQEEFQSIRCRDASQYQCDIREFSPNILVEKELGQEHCSSKGCLIYDLFAFNTSSARLNDKHAKAEDFELGGQYNYKEVHCWNILKENNDISGDGKTIEEALDQAMLVCEKRAI